PEQQAGQPAGSTAQQTTAPSTPSTTVAPAGSTGTTPPKEVDLANGNTKNTHHRSFFERLLWIVLAAIGLAALWIAAIPSLRAWKRHRRRAAGAAAGPDGRILVAWEEANGALWQAGAGRLPF